MLKTIGLWVGGFVLVVVAAFVLRSVGLIGDSFFNPWAEEIRYDTQKESQAHRDGLQRNLASLMNQYNAADSAGKTGIQATVRHQYSQADTSEFPVYLQTFLAQMGL